MNDLLIGVMEHQLLINYYLGNLKKAILIENLLTAWPWCRQQSDIQARHYFRFSISFGIFRFDHYVSF